MEDTILDSKVQAGAKLLDMKGPANWRGKINLDTLDISDSDECVLGQVFGDFEDAKKALGISRDGEEYRSSWKRAMYYGFDYLDTNFIDPSGQGLTEAWKRYLSR